MAQQKHIYPEKETCLYQRCYCEENIYQLCSKLQSQGIDDLFVTFISNQSQTIPIFSPKSLDLDDLQHSDYVVWDYHVILIQKKGTSTPKSIVFDFDSETLPFPCDFTNYAFFCLQPQNKLRNDFNRKYRVIPASKYLEHFSSDRSHMLDEDGEYKAEPPKLTAEGVKNNLFSHYVPMVKSDTEYGTVMEELQFLIFFDYQIKSS